MTQLERIAFKIVIIGEPAVGKTSLIRRFSDQSFSDNYKATVGADFDIKIIKLEKLEVFLTLWDIGGQDNFSELRNYYYSGADAAVLVYDLSNIDTLHELKKWEDDFMSVSSKDTPRIVIGNKKDLIDEFNQDSVLEFVKKRGLELILTSAKTNENVEESFRLISELCLKKYNISVV